MKQIKAAVGEDDDAAVAFLAAKPQNRFLEVRAAGFKGSPCGPGKTKVIFVKRVVYHA